mgnify:CR=1 FL=1
MTRETVLLTRTYIVDQPFIPIAVQPGDWSGLFDGGTPRINAYVATTPKETAEVILSSPEPDPLLARWQFGSGRSIAWTSDWEKLVRWLIPRNQLKSVDQKKPSRDPIQAPTKAKDNVTDVGVPTMLQRGVEAAEQVETANNPEATAAAQTDRTSNQSNPSESLDKMNRLLAAKKRGSNKR